MLSSVSDASLRSPSQSLKELSGLKLPLKAFEGHGIESKLEQEIILFLLGSQTLEVMYFECISTLLL